MKLAFLIFKYYPYGGLQRDCLRLAKFCANEGHEVHIFTMVWQGAQPEKLKVNLLSKKGISNHSRALNFAKQIQPQLKDFDCVIGFDRMPGLDFYLLVLFLFLYSRLFLTTRYIMFLALILVLQVPYAIYHIYQNYSCQFFNIKTWRWQPVVLTIALVFLIISSSFHIGDDKSFVLKTGQWVKQNIPADIKVLVGDDILSYYVNQPGATDKHLLSTIEKKPNSAAKIMGRYHLVILRASHSKTDKVEKFIKLHHYQIKKSFINNHHDKIFILRKS